MSNVRPQMSAASFFTQRMYAAFATAPRPAVEALAPHRCSECDDLRDSLQGYAVREVPDDKVEWLARSLPLLGPDALRYFLPRCIEYGISHHDSWTNESVLSFLATAVEGDPNWHERRRNFSVGERLIVGEYIALLQSSKDPDLDEEQLNSAAAFWASVA